MDSEQFRIYGKQMIDYMVHYLNTIEERRVFPDVQPGYMKELIPDAAPNEGEPWPSILSDVERVIMPGLVHWQHPKFHAYFPAGNSFPSIMGDMLSSAIGCVGFSWASSPACTELETICMDWFGKMLGLSSDFLTFSSTTGGGGCIQGSASECILTAFLSARMKCLKKLREEDPCQEDGFFLTKMVAYCSKQAHSAMEKAASIVCVLLRQLPTDDNFSLRGQTLRNAIERDLEEGMIPIFVGATLGTTASCSFDNILELAAVCRKHDVWIHVDAAYAGSALICPEYRYIAEGLDLVDSVNVNVNKWLLINFDCSAFFVRNSQNVTDTFNADPIYLRHKNAGSCIDYRHWGIPLSRRFRALKLWFVFRSYGISGLQSYIRNHCKLAKKFKSHVIMDKRLELMGSVTLGLVCFRVKGLNKLSEKLLGSINESGKLHMIPSSLNGKYMIRFCVCAENSTVEDIENSWDIIKEYVNKIIRPAEFNENEIAEPCPTGEVVHVKKLAIKKIGPIPVDADMVDIDEGVPFCSISELMIGRFKGRQRNLRSKSLQLW